MDGSAGGVPAEPGDPAAKMDFLKDRIGIEVGFGHASFIGIDLLKFQVASYSGLDRIDMGVYIVTTADFQKRMLNEFDQHWVGSLSFEKVVKYLPYFKSAIQVPIFVMGIEFLSGLPFDPRRARASYPRRSTRLVGVVRSSQDAGASRALSRRARGALAIPQEFQDSRYDGFGVQERGGMVEARKGNKPRRWHRIHTLSRLREHNI